jgi:acetyl-CoA synthetase
MLRSASVLLLLFLQWEPNHHHYNFDVNKGPISVTWFKGGKTNMCYNCLDRWVAAGRGNQVAFLW